MCTEDPKPAGCFKDNRATLHLHGGITPWISDGTPHQWITPGQRDHRRGRRASASQNVPDMTDAGDRLRRHDDGCQTFYYTNQQSARLMFYHDHAWGITRLNVYAGEAAGYLITDATEQKLVGTAAPSPASATASRSSSRTGPSCRDAARRQLAATARTRPGTPPAGAATGNFWYHHVYMPAQNPGDPSGMSAYGRWMYGPWFWPPAAGTEVRPDRQPVLRPDLQPRRSRRPGSTRPTRSASRQQIPGTPNISVGMEQFNDTPIVNGVGVPEGHARAEVLPLRILNAANDRFFNLQWYVADPTRRATARPRSR